MSHCHWMLLEQKLRIMARWWQWCTNELSRSVCFENCCIKSAHKFALFVLESVDDEVARPRFKWKDFNLKKMCSRGWWWETRGWGRVLGGGWLKVWRREMQPSTRATIPDPIPLCPTVHDPIPIIDLLHERALYRLEAYKGLSLSWIVWTSARVLLRPWGWLWGPSKGQNPPFLPRKRAPLAPIPRTESKTTQPRAQLNCSSTAKCS